MKYKYDIRYATTAAIQEWVKTCNRTINFDQNKKKVLKNAEHLHVYMMKYFVEVERTTRYPGEKLSPNVGKNNITGIVSLKSPCIKTKFVWYSHLNAT